jgi:xylan 1,4-beta-xylosidase
VPEPRCSVVVDDAAAGDAGSAQVVVDAAATLGALPHFWQSFGVGRLGLLDSAISPWGETLAQHIELGVSELGMDTIRAHGVLHDDIGIYREEEGLVVYDFARADPIFDLLALHGVASIIEFGSMPSDLASDPNATTFEWQAGVSPPKDYGRWRDLLFTFVDHYLARYGSAELARWRFEIWNEPDHPAFWTGTQAEYFELYDWAVEGIRAAYPEARVGGPCPTGTHQYTENAKLGENFLLHTAGGPLDLWTYHSWNGISSAVDGYYLTREFLKTHGRSELEVAVTEYGPTWQFALDPEPAETLTGAVFVADSLTRVINGSRQLGYPLPYSYAWWTLSDVFDEGFYRDGDPFPGTMGLLTRESVKTPTYNAYRMLHALGNEQLAVTFGEVAAGTSGLGARDASGGVQLLLFSGVNYHDVAGNPTYDSAPSALLDVAFTALSADQPYDYALYSVDTLRSNAFDSWLRLGRPPLAELDAAELEALRAAGELALVESQSGLCGTTLRKTVELASPGLLLLTLTPSP